MKFCPCVFIFAVVISSAYTQRVALSCIVCDEDGSSTSAEPRFHFDVVELTCLCDTDFAQTPYYLEFTRKIEAPSQALIVDKYDIVTGSCTAGTYLIFHPAGLGGKGSEAGFINYVGINANNYQFVEMGNVNTFFNYSYVQLGGGPAGGIHGPSQYGKKNSSLVLVNNGYVCLRSCIDENQAAPVEVYYRSVNNEETAVWPSSIKNEAMSHPDISVAWTIATGKPPVLTFGDGLQGVEVYPEGSNVTTDVAPVCTEICPNFLIE